MWRLMEQHPGKVVSMSDVAKAVGISRQAVYLHFASRTELIVATSNYVDEVKGLDNRLQQLKLANNATELLESCVEVWGNYIPEIYGIAKAMLMTRETDEAAAAAWQNNMNCVRDVCREIIESLNKEELLLPEWLPQEAIDLLWSMLSINNWEQLTMECGWSNEQYISRMTSLLKHTFVMNG